MMAGEFQKVVHKRNAKLILYFFVLIASLVLCFEWLWLCFKNWFVPFLGASSLLTGLVWAVFFWGFWNAAKCIWRICKERKELESACYNDLSNIKSANPEMCYRRLKDSKQTNTMLYGRLDVLMNCFANTSNKKEKLVPSMDDLHEMTMRIELSKKDVVILNTIISSLLIMGILGTLTGVHSVLIEDKYGLQLTEIAPALMPSAYAVLGMVILIISRAVYMNRLSQYIGQLDEVTMKYFFLPLSRDNKSDSYIASECWEGLESFKLKKIRKNKDVNKWKDIYRLSVETEWAIRSMKEKNNELLLINWKKLQLDEFNYSTSFSVNRKLTSECIVGMGKRDKENINKN